MTAVEDARHRPAVSAPLTLYIDTGLSQACLIHIDTLENRLHI